MRIIACFIVVVCLWSCSEELNLSMINEVERVNNFDVRWRKQVSKDSKDVIRNILNLNSATLLQI